MEGFSILRAAQAHQLHKQAYALFCGHRDYPWQYATFEKALTSPNSLLVQFNNECVGYAAVSEVAGEVEIEDICVASEYRRQGIADKLLIHLILQSERQNADYILLEVAQQNKQARALYEKHGFALITIRKNYYSLANNTFDDALLLQKMLRKTL
ncbi:MAG: ribosomal-protein-alanine N-acetyltransferase [Patiriisocius sp.]|jgi:ribosomal-protein-alanine N-acetyltransferase